jgi:hypothetical protein
LIKHSIVRLLLRETIITGGTTAGLPGAGPLIRPTFIEAAGREFFCLRGFFSSAHEENGAEFGLRERSRLLHCQLF